MFFLVRLTGIIKVCYLNVNNETVDKIKWNKKIESYLLMVLDKCCLAIENKESSEGYTQI
jgi:hypothetical protein